MARVNSETGDLKKQIDRTALQTKKEREALEHTVQELQIKLRTTSDALAAMQHEKNKACVSCWYNYVTDGMVQATEDAKIASQQLTEANRRADKEAQIKEKEMQVVRDAAEKAVATLTAQASAAERKAESLAAENQRLTAVRMSSLCCLTESLGSKP